MDQRIFLDFEYVFVISVAIVLLLMYLFYVRYPYDADQGKRGERSQEARGSTRTMSTYRER